MSRPPAVHQFHPSAAAGDAVSHGMLLTRDLLRELGFASDVFVVWNDARPGDRLRDYREYAAGPDDVLLVHHSMGHGFVDWVLAQPGRKVLVYHNVTPPGFFPGDARLQRDVALGRSQLVQYRPAMTAAFADSAFNAAELGAAGYERVTVLPLLVATDVLSGRPWNAGIVDASADVFTLLFVGRLERNKCQHDVIEIFRLVDRWLGRPAECVFVGTHNPCASYVHELRQQVAALGLADRIRFAGHVPEADLFAWYRAADVFVCMSEHEGFGVPLIEAMAFGVPVVAHASTSVPATMGGAGVLVEGKPLPEIAALVCRLAADGALRARIVERQRRRAAAFSRARLRGDLGAALSALGVGVARPAPARAVEPIEGEACSASTILRSAQRS